MIFTVFIISFVGLFLFFSLKIIELNHNKRFLSVNFLDRSDIFINRSISILNFYFNVFLFNLNKIPIFFNIFTRKIIERIKSLKDLLIIKIVGFLNFDNVKNIERNKGSVSLFLKNISDHKEGK